MRKTIDVKIGKNNVVRRNSSVSQGRFVSSHNVITDEYINLVNHFTGKIKKTKQVRFRKNENLKSYR